MTHESHNQHQLPICWLLFTCPTKASSNDWLDNKTSHFPLFCFRGQHKLNKVAQVLSRSSYFSPHGQLDETDKFTASFNGSHSLPKMTNGKEKISGWSDNPQMARFESLKDEQTQNGINSSNFEHFVMLIKSSLRSTLFPFPPQNTCLSSIIINTEEFSSRKR